MQARDGGYRAETRRECAEGNGNKDSLVSVSRFPLSFSYLRLIARLGLKVDGSANNPKVQSSNTVGFGRHHQGGSETDVPGVKWDGKGRQRELDRTNQSRSIIEGVAQRKISLLRSLRDGKHPNRKFESLVTSGITNGAHPRVSSNGVEVQVGHNPSAALAPLPSCLSGHVRNLEN